MILHYAGKYNGDESSLPQREHPAGAVPFKEPEDMQKLSLIANGGCMAVIILMAVPFIILGRHYFAQNAVGMIIAGILSLILLIPHELLHAVCYRKEVYLYNALESGMLFVAGTEDMSKARFIFMSLCPNLILGILPYIIFLADPRFVPLGLLGLICTGMGFGDYINVYHAFTQMPKGAVTYLSGMHSFWYMP